MDRLARTGDTEFVKKREMTGMKKLPWWLGGEGIKTTENKYIGLVEGL
jgi:hypothetical protein